MCSSYLTQIVVISSQQQFRKPSVAICNQLEGHVQMGAFAY